MKKALILKNIDREGPGKILPILKKNSFEVEIELAADETNYDGYIHKYDMLIILGGPDSANDETPKIQQELIFIKEWLKSDKPYFGICLGLQLMVKSLGGQVVPNNIKEIGFSHGSSGFNSEYTVTVNSLEMAKPFDSWYLDEFPVFQLHGETVLFEKYK